MASSAAAVFSSAPKPPSAVRPATTAIVYVPACGATVQKYSISACAVRLVSTRLWSNRAGGGLDSIEPVPTYREPTSPRPPFELPLAKVRFSPVRTRRTCRMSYPLTGTVKYCRHVSTPPTFVPSHGARADSMTVRPGTITRGSALTESLNDVWATLMICGALRVPGDGRTPTMMRSSGG